LPEMIRWWLRLKTSDHRSVALMISAALMTMAPSNDAAVRMSR
jgi:hypothetical protein